MEQGKLLLVRVIRRSQSSRRVSRGNTNKTLNQPPNTPGSMESRFSCSQVWGTSRKKLFTAQGYTLCSSTPCRLSRKHLAATWICPHFFQNWRKKPHPDEINQEGRGGIIPANISLLLHPCPALRAREIPLAWLCQSTQCPQERASGLILAVPAVAVSA